MAGSKPEIDCAPDDETGPARWATPLGSCRWTTPQVVLFALLGACSLAVTVYTAVRAAGFVGRTFPGFLLLEDGTVGLSGRLYAWNGLQEGLSFGDRIVTMNGERVSGAEEIYARAASFAAGIPVTYGVLEGVGDEIVSVRVLTQRFSWAGYYSVFGASWGVGLVFLTFGATAFLIEPGRRLAWAFFLHCLCVALIMVGLVDIQTVPRFASPFLVVLGLTVFSLYYLTLFFPLEIRPTRRSEALEGAILATCLGGALVVAALVRTGALSFTAALVGMGAALGSAMIAFTLWFWWLLYRRASRAEPLVLLRVKVACTGCTLGLAIAGAATGGLAAMGKPPLVNIVSTPAMIVTGLVIAYAILKHNLFDVNLLLRRSVVYSVITAALTAGYFLLILASNLILGDLRLPHTSILFALLFVVTVFLFHPLRQGLQRLLDRAVFRIKQAAAAEVEQASRRVLGEVREERVCAVLVDSLARIFQLERAGLYIRRGVFSALHLTECGGLSCERKADWDLCLLRADDPLVEALAIGRPLLRHEVPRRRDDVQRIERILDTLGRARAECAFPVMIGEDLAAVLLLGAKRNGMLFDSEDLRLLAQLTLAFSMAHANARSFRMVEETRANLERIVAERTSELRAALAEKEAAEDRLVHTERLAAIGQLVAGVAHELNNPLGSASSLVQTAIETLEGEADGALVELVDDQRFVLKELDRARQTVASLLDLSRQTSAYTEEVDLNRVVSDSLRVLFNKYKRMPVQLDTELEEHLPTFQGNFSQFGQVLLNLIGNAIHAVEGRDDGGKVVVRTGADPETQTVRVEVEDDGHGIAPEDLERIFEPFHTTKDVGRGTGLGLYISREIIQKHGGWIEVMSAPGKGTRFSVKLPVQA